MDTTAFFVAVCHVLSIGMPVWGDDRYVSSSYGGGLGFSYEEMQRQNMERQRQFEDSKPVIDVAPVFVIL